MPLGKESIRFQSLSVKERMTEMPLLAINVAEEDRLNELIFAHAVRQSGCPTRHGTFSRSDALALVAGTVYSRPRPAASVVIMASDGSVLVTQRALHMRTFPGKWVLPGGGVDKGETFEAAAVREVREEVGVVVSEARLVPLGLWESVYEPFPSDRIPRRHHCVFFFAVEIPDAIPLERIVLQQEEAAAAAWVPLLPLDFIEDHLNNRMLSPDQVQPLPGLPEGSTASEGAYFFMCEAMRRKTLGNLKPGSAGYISYDDG